MVPALFQLSFDHRDEIKRVGSGLGSCRELKRTSVDRRWDGEKTQRWEERDEGRYDETPLSLSLSLQSDKWIQKEKRRFSGITLRPRSLLTRLSLIIRRRTVCPRNRRIGGNARSDRSLRLFATNGVKSTGCSRFFNAIPLFPVLRAIDIHRRANGNNSNFVFQFRFRFDWIVCIDREL